MHIEKFTVCGRSYLRLVRSKQRLTRNGKPISGKELVLGLGPLAKHDDGLPDSLGRLRASFRAGKPLIKEPKLWRRHASDPRRHWAEMAFSEILTVKRMHTLRVILQRVVSRESSVVSNKRPEGTAHARVSISAMRFWARRRKNA